MGSFCKASRVEREYNLLPSGTPAVPTPAAPRIGSATPPRPPHTRYMPRASSTMASSPPSPAPETAFRADVQTPRPGRHPPRPLRRCQMAYQAGVLAVGRSDLDPGRIHSPWRPWPSTQDDGLSWSVILTEIPSAPSYKDSFLCHSVGRGDAFGEEERNSTRYANRTKTSQQTVYTN